MTDSLTLARRIIKASEKYDTWTALEAIRAAERVLETRLERDGEVRLEPGEGWSPDLSHIPQRDAQ